MGWVLKAALWSMLGLFPFPRQGDQGLVISCLGLISGKWWCQESNVVVRLQSTAFSLLGNLTPTGKKWHWSSFSGAEPVQQLLQILSSHLKSLGWLLQETIAPTSQVTSWNLLPPPYLHPDSRCALQAKQNHRPHPELLNQKLQLLKGPQRLSHSHTCELLV